MSGNGSAHPAVLVTGGTGGIGAAICRAFATAGHDVAFTYRSRTDTAERLAAELRERGATVAYDALDLADPDATARWVESVTGEFGGFGTVVHAAGPHVPMVHLSAVSPAQFGAAVDAEVKAFFNVVSAALPELRRSAGSVVAVTTAATTRYPVRDGLSAGPKAAIESLVRGFAAEEGRFGVRFNSVGPGMLVDGMADRLISSGELDDRALEVTKRNIPLRRFGHAVDIAEAVLFLASDKAGFISGQKLDVDGGYGI
ncbi:SDR family NAD(P)-dependent oxidoreductase [Rhodococcus yananensis]|uniref:SDR family NAD(P)-dependent oxidoreductase n=1 Tax=Rhodococcus yananensis TaxID=2879464 RepID=UPI003EBB66C6